MASYFFKNYEYRLKVSIGASLYVIIYLKKRINIKVIIYKNHVVHDFPTNAIREVHALFTLAPGRKVRKTPNKVIADPSASGKVGISPRRTKENR